jgi:hypothetical protein
MNLKDIISISGKPGLFRIVKQTATSCVIETLDEEKKRGVTNAHTQIASLNDITMYTEDDDVPLKEIFQKIEASGEKVPTAKADNKELLSFFEQVLPDYDKERVYVSDIKKLIKWYSLLKPMTLFTEKDPTEEKDAKEAKKEKAEDKITKKPVAKEKSSAPLKSAAKSISKKPVKK